MRASEINIYLLRKKIPQSRIAAALGLHRPTVSALLSGRLVVEHQLDAIAKYLGISRATLDGLIKGTRKAV